jgi:hypothetical protein
MKISWIEVELDKHVPDWTMPGGATEQRDTETLSGIHLRPGLEFGSTCPQR